MLEEQVERGEARAKEQTRLAKVIKRDLISSYLYLNIYFLFVNIYYNVYNIIYKSLIARVKPP